MNQKEQQGKIIGVIVFIVIAGSILYKYFTKEEAEESDFDPTVGFITDNPNSHNYIEKYKTQIITQKSSNDTPTEFSTPKTSPNVTPFSTPKEGSEEENYPFLNVAFFGKKAPFMKGGMQIKLCHVSVILAYLACIYIISTIYYLIVTRSYGTPFKDALEKYPELKKIKMKSAHERGNAFYVGLAIGVISMVILKPFGDCF